MLLKTLTLRNYRKYKDVDVELPDGVIGIIGLNGVGKTTLIEAIGGGSCSGITPRGRQKNT